MLGNYEITGKLVILDGRYQSHRQEDVRIERNFTRPERIDVPPPAQPRRFDDHGLSGSGGHAQTQPQPFSRSGGPRFEESTPWGGPPAASRSSYVAGGSQRGERDTPYGDMPPSGFDSRRRDDRYASDRDRRSFPQVIFTVLQSSQQMEQHPRVVDSQIEVCCVGSKN